ncbi:DUF2997 family protein [Actinomadura hallensis]|uniref:DUF2997 family protein n=1 Tax=Actinomadura hallensis TaxID=337895 RepID=A0A543IB75_9ACTN|nr:DUF2997 domain-containing protein [Actinomadura hallensis]TQM67818.1 DUF2997 family protein [Actinomadura hallensis]HLV74170.1 DUF2997 domain-containing protein [Vulgatibacteraceae bacterium]
MDETVEVTVKKDGGVEIHVTGIDGMACLKTTEELVRLLGGQVESQELTAEAYNEAYGEVDAVAEESRDRLWR